MTCVVLSSHAGFSRCYVNTGKYTCLLDTSLACCLISTKLPLTFYYVCFSTGHGSFSFIHLSLHYFSHLLLWMSTCLSVSSLFNSVWYPLVPSILPQMMGSYSLWLDNCPYRYSAFSFSIYGWWTSGQSVRLGYCVTPNVLTLSFPSQFLIHSLTYWFRYLFIYYVYECAHTMVCMRRSEDSLQKSVLVASTFSLCVITAAPHILSPQRSHGEGFRTKLQVVSVFWNLLQQTQGDSSFCSTVGLFFQLFPSHMWLLQCPSTAAVNG